MRQAVNGWVLTALGLGVVLVGCGQAPAPTAPPVGPATTASAMAIGSGAAPPAGASNPAVAGTPLVGAGAVDTVGGAIPDGQMVSPFDVGNPVVAFLEPALRTAIQQAAQAATGDGVDVKLTSGWRSKGFQQRLLDEAVVTYGSVAAASQFVASPEASMHVLGKAVDVGPPNADAWMIGNGNRFGLCQIYANEIWHFELAVDANGNCPPLRPNAAG
jgi:D-alanyl-D-alanine carboxypeptidase